MKTDCPASHHTSRAFRNVCNLFSSCVTSFGHWSSQSSRSVSLKTNKHNKNKNPKGNPKWWSTHYAVVPRRLCGFVEIRVSLSMILGLCFERSTIITRTNIKLYYCMASFLMWILLYEFKLWSQWFLFMFTRNNHKLLHCSHVTGNRFYSTSCSNPFFFFYIFWLKYEWCLPVSDIPTQGVLQRPSDFYKVQVFRYNLGRTFNITQSSILTVNGLFKPLRV